MFVSSAVSFSQHLSPSKFWLYLFIYSAEIKTLIAIWISEYVFGMSFVTNHLKTLSKSALYHNSWITMCSEWIRWQMHDCKQCLTIHNIPSQMLHLNPVLDSALAECKLLFKIISKGGKISCWQDAAGSPPEVCSFLLCFSFICGASGGCEIWDYLLTSHCLSSLGV